MTYDGSLLEQRTCQAFFKNTRLPGYSIDQIAHLPDYMRSMYVKYMTSKEKAALRSAVCRVTAKNLPPKFIRRANMEDEP